MNTLELALKFGRRLMAFFQDFSVGYQTSFVNALVWAWKVLVSW